MFKVIHPPPLTPNLPDVVSIKYFLNPTGHVGFNSYFFQIPPPPPLISLCVNLKEMRRTKRFATNSDFLIPLSLYHNGVNISYLKFWLTDQAE